MHKTVTEAWLHSCGYVFLLESLSVIVSVGEVLNYTGNTLLICTLTFDKFEPCGNVNATTRVDKMGTTDCSIKSVNFLLKGTPRMLACDVRPAIRKGLYMKE